MEEYIYSKDNAYTEYEANKASIALFEILDYNLYCPTSYMYLTKIAQHFEHDELFNFAELLLIISLLYSESIPYDIKLLAGAAYYISIQNYKVDFNVNSLCDLLDLELELVQKTGIFLMDMYRRTDEQVVRIKSQEKYKNIILTD